MKLISMTCLILLSSIINASESCHTDTALITASYKQTIITERNTTHGKETQRLNLWRRDKEVAYEYPDMQITEIWNQAGNASIRSVKYFDAHQRAIEYQSLISQNQEQWISKNQLIPEQLRKKMALNKTEGADCDKLEYYTFQDKNKLIKMSWSTVYQLPIFYEEQTAKTTYTLTLLNKSKDPTTINQFFSHKDSYQTTDYADIGDNESDPFLLSMINLGFIEHGASGFYNAKGQAMSDQSEHDHGHH